MSKPAIQYFDRASRTLKTEKIYGEAWMHLLYGNPVGRLATWMIVRRAIFSKWYGWKMKKRVSALRVLPFIVDYNVNVEDFAKSAFDYKSFNEFFCRALKPSARPIAPGDTVAVFPADGRHLAFQNVEEADGFYVKGEKFSVVELLKLPVPGNRQEPGLSQDAAAIVRAWLHVEGGEGDAESKGVGIDPAIGRLSELFQGGAMLISRLCPVDYHRFHFPVSGLPGPSRGIPGWLYSVNPIALRKKIRYLVLNKRQITVIQSERFGVVAMIEVGATNVGSIQQSFVPGVPVAKGDEKGFFSFGGSCAITLFQKGRIAFDRDIVEQSARQIETFAKMGDRLGSALA